MISGLPVFFTAMLSIVALVYTLKLPRPASAFFYPAASFSLPHEKDRKESAARARGNLISGGLKAAVSTAIHRQGEQWKTLRSQPPPGGPFSRCNSAPIHSLNRLPLSVDGRFLLVDTTRYSLRSGANPTMLCSIRRFKNSTGYLKTHQTLIGLGVFADLRIL